MAGHKGSIDRSTLSPEDRALLEEMDREADAATVDAVPVHKTGRWREKTGFPVGVPDTE